MAILPALEWSTRSLAVQVRQIVDAGGSAHSERRSQSEFPRRKQVANWSCEASTIRLAKYGVHFYW